MSDPPPEPATQKFLVYQDICFKDGGPKVFYVGKGSLHRVKDLERNDVHARIMTKYGQYRVVVFQTENEQEALDEEIRLIALHKTYVAEGAEEENWGANFTRGGDGTSGYRFSEEQRAKLSAATKEARSCPEYKAKMSVVQKDSCARPEVKAKRSAAQKESWARPEVRTKRNATRNSPEYKAKQSAAIKEALSRPEVKEKMKAIQNSLETKAKRSASLKAYYERRRQEKQAAQLSAEQCDWGTILIGTQQNGSSGDPTPESPSLPFENLLV